MMLEGRTPANTLKSSGILKKLRNLVYGNPFFIALVRFTVYGLSCFIALVRAPYLLQCVSLLRGEFGKWHS